MAATRGRDELWAIVPKALEALPRESVPDPLPRPWSEDEPAEGPSSGGESLIHSASSSSDVL